MSSERQTLETDIVCVGFGPAAGGFLTTLARAVSGEDGGAPLESRVMPGMPLQVVCYERADDIGFGVSGVVTKGEHIRKSFPDLNLEEIPFASPVSHEKVMYLLDPLGASRRSTMHRAMDSVLKLAAPAKSVTLPYIPPFLRKDDGMLLSIGQFNQWVGSQLMASGVVQIWPAMPVDGPLIEGSKVCGVQLVDQGVNKAGEPDAGFMPGMEVRAGLTVAADGPVGPVSQKLDRHFGLPEGHHQRDWAVGMKMVVELPESCELKTGTVLHTLGYPEPEIFGFMYVYPDGLASLGIFVPSWFNNPVRTSYRYLQHWMQHPALWKHLKGAKLRSWGAKSLQEAGRRGEPHLAGDGYARIGESSGSTNVLTNSGVDEAWGTGVLLAEGAIEILRSEREFTKENLEKEYVRRRRESSLEQESRTAERARDGFQKGFFTGVMGMGLAGVTGGRINLGSEPKRTSERMPTVEKYYQGRIPSGEIEAMKADAEAKGDSLHDRFMDKAGWPAIEYDNELLMSHQDALLKGGKVQAPGGYADHVAFVYPNLCESCGTKICVELCSGQAIAQSEGGGVPAFDREKCVHCGACLWSCAAQREDDPERGNIEFRAGAGGLHSAEN